MSNIALAGSGTTKEVPVTVRPGMVGLVREAVRGCIEHRVAEMAAAISYYAVFSLAPLLVIAVAIAGLIFGNPTARQEAVERFGSMVGERGGRLVGSLIDNASVPQASALATVMGIVTLIAAAGWASGQLNEALDRIWGVRKRPGGAAARFLRRRFVSFVLTLVLAFLLLASLATSVAFAGLDRWAGAAMPARSMRLLDLTVSFGMISIFAAFAFRFLPSARIEWRDVWAGAAVTSALFALGNFLIGLYFGWASTGSVYGAAGSLTVILIWVYSSSLILLFGSEMTRARAARFGRNGQLSELVEVTDTACSVLLLPAVRATNDVSNP